ncbi:MULTISPECIES: PD-(D/E)XK motif protein [unclassified Myxococcus]|uniref:PD-(D/E)XK motif protein n=1 Tax=Myxococcus TaxID=32 RepID=UPI001143379F|nr:MULTISPECIES: PD-(D/E)XK motif protein [unclassified Myxococcus]NOK01004.1 PD-(D/E)XK motif protein [Myxococcus xanthus]
MKSVEEAWRLIAEEPKLQAGLVARRIYPESRLEIYAGLDRPSDVPLVCIHVRPAALRMAGERLSSAGFVLLREINPHPGPNSVRLSLWLAAPPYRDVFGVLAQDVVDSVAKAVDQRNAVSTFVERLRRWQEFLERHGPEGLGAHAQRGLYGELWCLRHQAIRLIGAGCAIPAWTGPDRSNQDFQFASCAVEVKTTASSPHHQVAISNIRQLDETHVPALLLLHVALEIRHDSGETLVGMVESLRDLLRPSGQPLSLFEEKLRSWGYLDVHAVRYGESAYVVRSHDFYRVMGSFPRLTEAEIPDGVGDVRYSVALSACSAYRLSPDAAAALIVGK